MKEIAFRIYFKTDSEYVTILPLKNCDTEFLQELLALIVKNRDSFKKDFEADILIDEEEGKMYGRIPKEDCTAIRLYRTPTPGRIFMLLHDVVDLMGGIRWTCVWPPEE